jgi:hypothetical protein
MPVVPSAYLITTIIERRELTAVVLRNGFRHAAFTDVPAVRGRRIGNPAKRGEFQPLLFQVPEAVDRPFLTIVVFEVGNHRHPAGIRRFTLILTRIGNEADEVAASAVPAGYPLATVFHLTSFAAGLFAVRLAGVITGIVVVGATAGGGRAEAATVVRVAARRPHVLIIHSGELAATTTSAALLFDDEEISTSAHGGEAGQQVGPEGQAGSIVG